VFVYPLSASACYPLAYRWCPFLLVEAIEVKTAEQEPKVG